MYMVLRQVLVSVMFNNAAYREYIAWLDDNAKNYLVAFGARTFFFFFRETKENYDSRIFNHTPTLLKFVKVCVSTTLQSLKTSASKRDLSARETKDSRVDYSVEQNTSDEESLVFDSSQVHD